METVDWDSYNDVDAGIGGIIVYSNLLAFVRLWLVPRTFALSATYDQLQIRVIPQSQLI